MSSPLRRGLHANTAGFRLPFHPTPPNLDNYVRDKVATTAIRGSGGSLDFIWIFLYKKQPNHFYTVLLYNRGTEPQIILFYRPGEVQVPQVPRMQGILVGYGSKLSATLDSDFPNKIRRAWEPRRIARGLKINL